MIRVEKFHPKDDIGTDHIEVKFDAKNAHIRVVNRFSESLPAIIVEHLGSLHRVLKIALHTAQRNKIDLVALISDKYDRHAGLFY